MPVKPVSKSSVPEESLIEADPSLFRDKPVNTTGDHVNEIARDSGFSTTVVSAVLQMYRDCLVRDITEYGVASILYGALTVRMHEAWYHLYGDRYPRKDLVPSSHDPEEQWPEGTYHVSNVPRVSMSPMVSRVRRARVYGDRFGHPVPVTKWNWAKIAHLLRNDWARDDGNALPVRPPHMSLGAYAAALGVSLDDCFDRETGKPVYTASWDGSLEERLEEVRSINRERRGPDGEPPLGMSDKGVSGFSRW